MGIKEESFNHLRHELRTSLNHIMGYSEILQEDAKEFQKDDIIPDLRRIKNESEKIREYISQNLISADSPAKDPEKIRADLYRFLFDIIGTARQIRERFSEDESVFSIPDIDKILTASNTILDIIDSQLGDILQVSRNAIDHMNELIEIRENSYTPKTPEKASPNETGIILVVDDNEMNRDMLARHLERQGYTLVTADNGSTALDILNRQTIDLVILDIMMPAMNGYEVLETMKSSETLKHIPVIMISALEDMDSVVRCIEMGAEDYLPKSFDPVLLRARIEASLEKKRLRDQENLYLRTILESQRILAGELAEAAEYVRNLLPPFIEESNIRTEWVFVPSAQLGGDSFGYHWLNEDSLAIYLLDVSGHGIGAALLSVSVMNVLRTQSLADTDFFDPGAVLTMLNKNFQMDVQNNMFFSIWYGVYNRRKREISYGSAGAPPAVLMTDPLEHGDGNSERIIRRLGAQDMIIGIRDNLSYSTSTIHVPENSRLFLFSDGAFEIRRTNGRMLHLEEFVNLLYVQPWHESGNLEFVLDQLHGIAMSESFNDDVSILEVSIL